MSEQRPSRELEKIIVRLPDGMRDRLAEVAKANGRSTNAEVVARLAYTFERETVLVRTGAHLPEPGALQAAIHAIQFALEHQEDLERMADEKGIEVPWAREAPSTVKGKQP